MDPDECLLRDVHGVVRILHHAERKLVDPALVPLDQLPEGILVAFLGRADQRTILDLVHSDVLQRGKFTGIPRYQTKRSKKQALGGNPRKPNLV